jgi:hypothetical protein
MSTPSSNTHFTDDSIDESSEEIEKPQKVKQSNTTKQKKDNEVALRTQLRLLVLKNPQLKFMKTNVELDSLMENSSFEELYFAREYMLQQQKSLDANIAAYSVVAGVSTLTDMITPGYMKSIGDLTDNTELVELIGDELDSILEYLPYQLQLVLKMMGLIIRGVKTKK